MIDGQPIDECGTSDATSGDLEIVFDASDVDGHLGGYALTAHWGSNHVNDLLALGTLHLLSGDAKGPSYAQAISGAVEQGAARPTWNGGRMRLTVPVSVAFPEPCCYELRLEAWKRIIVGGGGGSPCGFNCSIDPVPEPKRVHRRRRCLRAASRHRTRATRDRNRGSRSRGERMSTELR